MLSLEQIKNSIHQLTKMEDPCEIQAGIHELFFNLMCADQPLYLIYVSDCPYLSSVSTDQAHLYLHLFSHRELADQYAEQVEQAEVCEHSLLDILQIGRWALLSGGYGFILNGGDLWIGCTISDFLSLFFSRICGDENLISADCIHTICFINEVRRNRFFCYGAVCDEIGEWTGRVRMEASPPITLQSLFHVPTDILTVERYDEADLTISKESLLKGLSLCGLTENPDEPAFGTDYIDEPSIENFEERRWRVTDLSDLALTFAPANPSADSPMIESVPVDEETEEVGGETEGTEVPAEINGESRGEPAEDSEKEDAIAGESTEIGPENNSKENQDGFLSKVFHRMKMAGGLREIRWKLKPKQKSRLGNKQEQPENETLILDEDPFADEISEEVERTEDRASGKGKMSGKMREKKKRNCKKLSKQTVIISVLAAILAAGAGAFVVRTIWYQGNLQEFRTCVSCQDYANAYTLYIDTGFGKDADAILTEELDRLVLCYADNKISAGELSASLDALSNFPSIAQNLEIARLTASKLEESKNAYVRGKESTDLYERLNIWRQVVPLDSANYAAVQQNVADNQTQYVNVLRSDIEYCRTRVLDFAEDRFEVLSYWYPDSEYIPILSREFESNQAGALSFYPIKIRETTIQQEFNGYWTLHIGWKNASVKTIDYICFSVIALGEDGNVVTCEDGEEKWTIFDAYDRSRYEPGEEPDSGYYWYRAFYGPDVREVKLTAVNITYRDGSSAVYTSDADLNRMQSN